MNLLVCLFGDKIEIMFLYYFYVCMEVFRKEYRYCRLNVLIDFVCFVLRFKIVNKGIYNVNFFF